MHPLIVLAQLCLIAVCYLPVGATVKGFAIFFSRRKEEITMKESINLGFAMQFPFKGIVWAYFGGVMIAWLCVLSQKIH